MWQPDRPTLASDTGILATSSICSEPPMPVSVALPTTQPGDAHDLFDVLPKKRLDAVRADGSGHASGPPRSCCVAMLHAVPSPSARRHDTMLNRDDDHDAGTAHQIGATALCSGGCASANGTGPRPDHRTVAFAKLDARPAAGSGFGNGAMKSTRGGANLHVREFNHAVPV